MDIIPVIDLMDGMAVHARRGVREHYRPVDSPLCSDPDPAALLRAYLDIHPFRTVYIADLDAIRRRGDQDGVVAALAARFPELEFWIDAGRHVPAVPGLRRVLGTESGFAPGGPADAPGAPPILSLDFDGDRLIGDPALLEQPSCWPDTVVVMCLRRIGAGAGPALHLLSRVRELAGPGRRVYLAGGVAGVGDLVRARDAGADGALIASALHDGSIGAAELGGPALQQKKTPA